MTEPIANCGFKDGPQGSGSDLLVLIGPTIAVDIGFDPSYRINGKKPSIPEIKSLDALIDTGAGDSCIDNILAAALRLPVVDRLQIAGSNGAHTANVYQAQIHVPSLGTTVIGRFIGVDLIAGGQRHQALIGRTFLEHYRMFYDGDTGEVTLS